MISRCRASTLSVEAPARYTGTMIKKPGLSPLIGLRSWTFWAVATTLPSRARWMAWCRTGSELRSKPRLAGSFEAAVV
jgi:hypothetical protein